MSTSTRCAACKYLRRRCSEDCVLAPYFPSSDPERFLCVHRIFGASNVSRMLQQLPVQHRHQAANTMSAEARWRVGDLVYGSVGVINHLQRQIIEIERELAETRAQIAIYSSEQQHDETQAQVAIYGTQQQYEQQLSVFDQTFPGFHLPPNLP